MDASQTCGEFLEMFRRKETNGANGEWEEGLSDAFGREDPTLRCIVD